MDARSSADEGSDAWSVSIAEDMTTSSDEDVGDVGDGDGGGDVGDVGDGGDGGDGGPPGGCVTVAGVSSMDGRSGSNSSTDTEGAHSSRSRGSISVSHSNASQEQKKNSWRQRKVLMSLAVADFTSYLSMSVMSPFFPSVGAKKGISATWVGLIFASYALFVFMGSPIWGGLMKRIGPRFMFLSGMFVAGMSNVCFGMLDLSPPGITFIALCLAVRFVEAMGSAAFITSVFAIIVDEFPDNVGTVIGTLEIFVGLGMIVGPAMGGVLYGVGGFKLPFMLIGAFRVLVCLPVNWYLIPRDPDTRSTPQSAVSDDAFLLGDAESLAEQPRTKPTVFNLLKSFNSWVVCLSVCATSSVWAFLDPTLQPHLAEFNLDSETLGLIFLLASTSYALFAPLWGYVADRVTNTSPLVTAGMLLCGACLFFIGPSPLISSLISNQLWLNMVCMVVLGGANALALIPTFEMMVQESARRGMPEDISTYGVVSGVWGSFYSLGEFIGPAAAGRLQDSLGFPWASTGYSLLVVSTAILMFVNGVVRTALARRASPTTGPPLLNGHRVNASCLETTKLLPCTGASANGAQRTSAAYKASQYSTMSTTFIDPAPPTSVPLPLPLPLPPRQHTHKPQP